MKRHRVLGLVAGTLLVSGAVVNAGQEPASESTLGPWLANILTTGFPLKTLSSHAPVDDKVIELVNS